MKRVLALILTLVFLIHCGACFAEWDERMDEGGQFSLTGWTKGILLENISNLDPRTGPGTLYDAVDAGILAASKGDEIKILTQVYSGGTLWVLAEVPSFYSSNVRCYLTARSNTEKIRFNASAVPTEVGPDDLLSEWQCMSYEYEAYRFGPGDNYAFTGTVLSHNDNAWVILMDGDWALVESSNRYDGVKTGIFARRGWVRFDTLIY